MKTLSDTSIVDTASLNLKPAARERPVARVPMLVRVARVAVLPRHVITDTTPALVASCPPDLNVLVIDPGKLKKLVVRQAALGDEYMRARSTGFVDALDAP